MTEPFRVLVTGSAGRLGSAVCAALAADRPVTGLDRRRSRHTHHVADLAGPSGLGLDLAAFGAIVHVAALHAPHVGRVPDDAFHQVNVEATERLAWQAVRSGVRRFVFTSTTALYGAGSRTARGAAWIDPTTPPAPTTVYHRSKLEAEARLARVAAASGLSVTVLRVGRCFPEPADLMAVYRLHRGIDARDVASAHAAALRLDHPGEVRTFIVSGRTPFEPEDGRLLHEDAPEIVWRRAPALAAAFEARGWVLPAHIDRVYVSHATEVALDWRPRYGALSVVAQSDAADPAVLAPTRSARPRPVEPEPCA
jgi:nucleoside-diphosphate-sugar epimerase